MPSIPIGRKKLANKVCDRLRIRAHNLKESLSIRIPRWQAVNLIPIRFVGDIFCERSNWFGGHSAEMTDPLPEAGRESARRRECCPLPSAHNTSTHAPSRDLVQANPSMRSRALQSDPCESLQNRGGNSGEKVIT